jgi:hypothetical protein
MERYTRNISTCFEFNGSTYRPSYYFWISGTPLPVGIEVCSIYFWGFDACLSSQSTRLSFVHPDYYEHPDLEELLAYSSQSVVLIRRPLDSPDNPEYIMFCLHQNDIPRNPSYQHHDGVFYFRDTEEVSDMQDQQVADIVDDTPPTEEVWIVTRNTLTGEHIYTSTLTGDSFHIRMQTDEERIVTNTLTEEELTSEDTINCPICLNDTKMCEAVKTVCNHTFCHSCIYEWVNNQSSSTCPMCRRDIV